jgi:hypothetical protein
MANAEQIRVWNDVNAERWIRLRGVDGARPPSRWRAGTGDALGIDICAPFLEVARREAAFGARYLLADAQVQRFEEKFALCFSRFGRPRPIRPFGPRDIHAAPEGRGFLRSERLAARLALRHQRVAFATDGPSGRGTAQGEQGW